MVTMSCLYFRASLGLAGSKKACLTVFMSGHLSDSLVLIGPSIQPFCATMFELSLNVTFDAVLQDSKLGRKHTV
jgi:hypothetical protein